MENLKKKTLSKPYVLENVGFTIVSPSNFHRTDGRIGKTAYKTFIVFFFFFGNSHGDFTIDSYVRLKPLAGNWGTHVVTVEFRRPNQPFTFFSRPTGLDGADDERHRTKDDDDDDGETEPIRNDDDGLRKTSE